MMRSGVDELWVYSQVLDTCHSERSEESAVRGSVQEEIPRCARNDKSSARAVVLPFKKAALAAVFAE